MLDQPIDYELIYPGTFNGVYILDRWSGIAPTMEVVTDMSDPDFGPPTYYPIVDSEGEIYARVHHSRLLRFIG